jgi:hypothetical protein
MKGFPERMNTRENNEQVFFHVYNRADKYAKKAREKSLYWLYKHKGKFIEFRYISKLDLALQKLIG